MGDAKATRSRLVVALLLGATALLAITFHVSVAPGLRTSQSGRQGGYSICT